ncbi:putative DNA topoisomerase 6 subunit A [Paratrimastix pyriformis]|uniref:DNA topoisomerase 6 subunit A n=1 Tax=Paratrimastix pyriformis TaxID=342808 RepID=A0ABQ8UW05_9EUKA|nr:putative DNA topoisomerase 6 subunit A [Paratrimastix pyriformis]
MHSLQMRFQSNLVPSSQPWVLQFGSSKGLVIGPVTFQENGNPIDCARVGLGGKPIISGAVLGNIRSTAQFLVVVEKEAIFARLAEDRFHEKLNCILVTGKGFPDLGTQEFVRTLSLTLGIPTVALVDADPFGVSILCQYAFGNEGREEHIFLRTEGLKWLGVRPSDLDRYHVPASSRIPLTAKDRERGRKLLEGPISRVPQWRDELLFLLHGGEKAEVEGLSWFSVSFLTEQYLPGKIREKDWI